MADYPSIYSTRDDTQVRPPQRVQLLEPRSHSNHKAISSPVWIVVTLPLVMRNHARNVEGSSSDFRRL
jgi:hypothetical protein